MLITSELRIFAITRTFDGEYFIIAMLFLKLHYDFLRTKGERSLARRGQNAEAE
jgi:hypothetical protein